MYNTYNFNTTNFNNNYPAFPVAGTQDDIVFNDYSLQNTSIVTEQLVQDNMPKREFQSFAIPRDDGETFIGDYWRAKRIRLEGTIHKTTNSELESTIDDMKRYLGEPNKNLDIKIDGDIRRYLASLINGDNMFSRRKGYHVTFCPFEAVFVCLEPFGKDLNYDATTFFDKTDLSFTEVAANAGTVTAKPYWALDLTAASGVTAISFENETTGQTITITRSFSAGEYLTIDAESKTVKVDGVAVDYDGIFPDFEVGSNRYTLTITGTSATWTLTTKHLPKYL